MNIVLCFPSDSIEQRRGEGEKKRAGLTCCDDAT
jgi:hypothetical protein